jgi:hypothetical protein
MATGIKLLARDSFTSVTSVSLDNVFSNTYKQYKIITDVESAGDSDVLFRLRVGGTDNSAGNYSRNYLAGSGTSVFGANETSQTSWSGLGRAENGVRQCNITEVLNPFQSAYTSAYSSIVPTATGNLLVISMVYYTSVTTSYDGFTIAPGFNSTTFSGTVQVYGYVI